MFGTCGDDGLKPQMEGLAKLIRSNTCSSQGVNAVKRISRKYPRVNAVLNTMTRKSDPCLLPFLWKVSLEHPAAVYGV